MGTNYLEWDAGVSRLSEALTKDAGKLGLCFDLDAKFDTLTNGEQEKVDCHIFQDSLMFSVDVNLHHSKKAFLNLLKGFEDPEMFIQLWNLRPHDPHVYQPPIGKYINYCRLLQFKMQQYQLDGLLH